MVNLLSTHYCAKNDEHQLKIYVHKRAFFSIIYIYTDIYSLKLFPMENSQKTS